MKNSRKRLICVLIAALFLFSAAAGADPLAPGAYAETEKNGDIVILYTSDIHCGIDQGFGFAGLEQVRDYLIAQGNEVILVDNGDSVQGEPVGTMTKGDAIMDLMNDMGYSVAIPGNHDFDYGMDQFFALTKKATFPYISCNFNYKGDLVFEPYVIRELAGKKIGFVGVTTPQTLTTSTPTYFQDENGNFVYGFLQDKTGEGVYDAVQSAVDAARAEGADYVIVLGHMGNRAEYSPWAYGDVISHCSGIDAFLDGHSHDTDQVVVKDKDGKDVPRSACGTKMAYIGWCRISADGNVSAGLYGWNNDVAAPKLLGIENDMSRAVSEATDELNEKLSEVVAHSLVALTTDDPTEKDANGAPVRMIRRAETNLGDLCADAYRDQSGTEVAVVNGGGIRDSIPAGDITLNDILSVHPFGNSLCVVQVSGQQILDALEWGARSIPNENGAFLQVSGISYEVHTYIDSSCTSDEDGMFTGVTGERRVKNVLVNGEPIDPDRAYTLASHEFLLLKNGDGNTSFDGATLLQDRFKLDNQVLIDYITETLGGEVGEEYENPCGEGRIVIVEEKP